MISSSLHYKLSNDVDVDFTIKTPHYYMLALKTDFGKKYADTPLKLNLLKFGADLECDEHTFTYPTTFHANFIFAKMVALHAQVMTEKANNLEAQLDVVARLTKNVYGGGEIIYDDKAKSLILRKYGLFWKAAKNFNFALEYHQVGDKNTIEASAYHKTSSTTRVGSHFSFDTQFKKLAV